MRARTPARRLAAALFSAVLLSAGAIASPAAADDRDNVLAMRLADLEAQGLCQEAVDVYRQSGQRHARMALVVGRCQVRTRDYSGAIETLTAVADMPEAPADADLQLAIAEYHQGDLAGARSSLARARARGSEGAMLELYTGLLQLQADEARNAANSLERARRSNPQAVEPIASYYAFLAWRSIEEEERAKAALERVRESDPDGPWIAEAERLLGSGSSSTPRFWATLGAGLEYDTNVVVKGGVPNVFINGETTARKRDGRGIWTVDVGTVLFRADAWSGGLIGAYTGTANFEITEFDTHYPTAGAWLDFQAAERTTLRVRYDYAYAWVNADPYSSSNVLTGTLFQGWEKFGLTEFTALVGWYDFKYDRLDPDDPPGTPQMNPLDVRDIDRDGTDFSVGVLQRFRPGFQDLELNGGYRYTWYTSDGAEFDYMAHRFFAGFGITLPLEIEWGGFVAFTYRPFDEVSAFQTSGVHRDRQWETGTELEKYVSENVSVLARYSFTDSGSNTGEYDYDRHIVGAYVRIHFR